MHRSLLLASTCRPLALVFLLAGCRDAAPPAPVGRTEATEGEQRTIPLDGRTLVLDGFAGDIRVEVDSSMTTAQVRLVRRARGLTEASARARLPAITVETGGDADIYQIVWRADRPDVIAEDGLRADVIAFVPAGTPVVVRTAAGGVAIFGATGDLDVGIAAGTVQVERAVARRLRVDARAGDVAVSAADLPRGAEWTVSTAAGDVDFSVPDGASVRVDAQTAAGTVRGVEAHRDGRATARLRTGAGDVTVGRATDISELEPHDEAYHE